jgi:superfamily II DNA/RNA helicase
MNSFQAFRFHGSILKGLKKCSITSPTTEQKTILKAVSGQTDLLINTEQSVSPEVGYLPAALSEAATQNRRGGTKILILTEDAERAESLKKWVTTVGEDAQIRAVSLFEHEPLDDKKGITLVASGPTVLIASPQTFAPILESSNMTFREVLLLVVEKAEEIDHWDDVKTISDRILSKCQRIFIAAKDSRQLREAEAQILKSPELVKAVPTPEPKTADAPSIPKDLTQYYINVPPRSKISVLLAFLKETDLKSHLIFTASGRTADRLFKILRKNDFRVVSLHKGLDEQTFQQRLELFTSRKVQHLLVGDYSASELSPDGVEQVINYDVPEDVHEYKLRADLVSTGNATRILSLVSKQDQNDILGICNELGYAPKELPMPEAALARLQDHSESSKSASSNEENKNSRGDRGKSSDRDKGSDRGKNSDRSKGGGKNKGSDRGKSSARGKDSDRSKSTERSKSTSRSKRSERNKRTDRGKSNGRSNNNQGRGKIGEMDISKLPQPTYDQLAGGRAGTKKTEKKGGLFSRIKKLFGG